MILFLDDTRRSGTIGLIATIATLGLGIYFHFPPPPQGVFFGLVLLGGACFYVYLIAIRRRRVVTLLDDQLLWNTSTLTAPLEMAPVSEIRIYRVEPYGDNSHSGEIFLPTGWMSIGALPLEVHRRIARALYERNPTLQWQES